MKANRWEIDNFWTPEQCQEMIDRAEESGEFELATLQTPSIVGYRLNYRNNDKYTFDDEKLASEIWELLKDDENLHANEGWTPIGLNPQFRVYRYDGEKQHFFALHYDASYDKIPGVEQSWVTLLIYLNEEFEGGETSFQGTDGDYDLVPKTGKAAMMTQHNYLHQAQRVTNGTKYVLRTDVMYRNNEA